MAYRIERTIRGPELVIDGWEKGIQQSPYLGISNIRNLNTIYYPGVTYVNYRRQQATVTDTGSWYAGTHSTDVSNNSGWIFSAAPSSPTMANPVSKAVSPLGLIYIQDSLGQIWKQSSVNSSTFALLEGGAGRFADGNAGIAFWQNYLVVFGSGVIEFCGDGTGDAGIISSNWNIVNNGLSVNTSVITTNFAVHNDRFTFSTALYSIPKIQVNDPVTFTSTGTLPTGITAGTTYYILSVNTSLSYITISTTIGGSAVTVSSDGSGVHTITDNASVLPIGNSTSVSLNAAGAVVGDTTLTIVSYVGPDGVAVGANWLQPTGLYNIIMADGSKIPANFTNGSATVNLLSPLLYISTGTWQVSLLDTTVTNYKPYVSKVDGSLYFANGQFLGRLAITSSPNINFNPQVPITYSVSTGVTALPEEFTDTITDMVDLNNQLVITGKKDFYTWDYLSAATSSPRPIGEPVTAITNLLNNVYILAGQKGNIYVSNGYSAQLLTKMPDYIAGVFDPVWTFGGLMTHRSRLYFQAMAQTTAGANIMAGIFSLMVSPSMLGEQASGLVMEAQNSYGLTPASGASGTGLLIDASPSSSGQDAYYSAWSNGASTGGIDYNDTSLWQNFEPTIETDIIPIGNILDKNTLGNIQFKLDRPMASGDQIKLYWRPSLSDSYTQIGGTFTNTQLSDYAPSNVSQSQWAQFMVTFKAASSGSSFIPLRELRLSMT